MSLIHVYIDKKDTSKDKYIKLIKKNNINFLEFNIPNDEKYKLNYGIDSLPAIRFKDKIIYDINEKSINEVIENFNSFVKNLPKSNKTFSRQILVNTIKVSNKKNLLPIIKYFSNKHKKSTYTI